MSAGTSRPLVTGAKGFVGKNLVAELHNRGYETVYEQDIDTPPEQLAAFCRDCGFVFHFAGVNRPREQTEFMEGNCGALSLVLSALREAGNACPVLLSSSTQAALDNPYGESKRAGEALLLRYGAETGAAVYPFRFPNIFGKWSRPNYNSAVATFCYHTARGLPITVNDPNVELTLLYIDDLLDCALGAQQGKAVREGDFCVPPVTHRAKLGWIADTIRSFGASRAALSLPALSDPLTRKLFATYQSFLPEDGMAYPLTAHADARGSFTEFLRTPDRGQVSINVSNPGVTKGNHWHHTKNEKFLVVAGEAAIRLRHVGEMAITTYTVSGERPTVVDIVPGYTHSIENIGAGPLVTVMWASEPFDPARPDTYYLEV